MSAGIRKEMGRVQLKAELKAKAERRAQPDPQPAEDLERALAELRLVLAGALVGWEDVDGQDLRGTRLMFEGIYSKVVEYVTPAFAALARERELREALGELVEAREAYSRVDKELIGLALRDDSRFGEVEREVERLASRVDSAFEKAEALLAQPAAGEEDI